MLTWKKVSKPLLTVWRHVSLKDLADQDMARDRVEGLGDVYCSYKGSKGGFGVVKTFEGSLHEGTQQSGVGMEGPEAVLGKGEGKERGDLVENESL